MNTPNKNRKQCCYPFWLLSLLFIINTAYASLDKLPRGCDKHAFEFKHQQLILYPHEKGNKDSIYFVFNKSKQDVHLFRTRDEHSEYGITDTVRIRPKQWGVYSSDKKKVKFICTVANKKYPYGEIVGCEDKLKLCEYTNVKYGLNNRGNYWLIDSTTKNGAVRRSIIIGVLLSQGEY